MTTPDYVKRAQKEYMKQFDIVQIRLPAGTKERIKKIVGEAGSIPSFCVDELLEVIAGYEAAASYQQPEEIPEPVPEIQPEPEEDPRKKFKNPVMQPVTAEEAEVFIAKKKESEKAEAERLAQEKEDRLKAEQDARAAEIMGHLEKIRSGMRETWSVEDQRRIDAALSDPELMAVIRDPAHRDYLIEQMGEPLYSAVLSADKEKRRQESIDLAAVEMGQTGRPPF